jgi:hypothetical protein
MEVQFNLRGKEFLVREDMVKDKPNPLLSKFFRRGLTSLLPYINCQRQLSINLDHDPA